MQRLRWQGGNRLEQRLARTLAAELLREHFAPAAPAGTGGTRTIPAALEPEPDWDPLAYQAPDGSIAILPYSDGDLYLSALAADVAGDRFDPAALADYFQRVLDDPGTDRERAITALYGLAPLKQPVLPEVRGLLQAADLRPAEQLLAAMALAALGDEILTATARGAALAARLGEPGATALVGYLLENPADEVLLLLESVLAAGAALPGLPAAPVAFTYVQDGREQRVELKPGESLRWDLAASALADLHFAAVNGDVGLTVSYLVPLDGAALRAQPGFAVSARMR